MALLPNTQLVLSSLCGSVSSYACSSVHAGIKIGTSVSSQCCMYYICMYFVSTAEIQKYNAYVSLFIPFLLSLFSTYFLASPFLLLFPLLFSLLFFLPSILPPTINRCAIYLSVQVNGTGLCQYRTDLGVLPIDWTD